jgi:hypothetical protein
MTGQFEMPVEFEPFVPRDHGVQQIQAQHIDIDVLCGGFRPKQSFDLECWRIQRNALFSCPKFKIVIMQPTLLILAAGMASRYGSMKQIQGFGPSGETIMDYSIYDAIRAGFTKVVFIIRKDFADDFKALMEPKLKGKVELDYVYQDLRSFTGTYPVPADRTKPWGTAHAVLCAKDAIKEPFAVINADDFYGRDAFEKAYKFLTKDVNPKTQSIIGRATWFRLQSGPRSTRTETRSPMKKGIKNSRCRSIHRSR